MVGLGVISSRKLIRSGICSLLLKLCVDEELRILFEVDSIADACEQVIASKPHILIIDCDSSLTGRFNGILRMKELSPATRCLLLTDHAEEEFEVQAARKGAWGVVTHHSDPVLLQQAIGKVASGEMWFSHETLGKAIQDLLQHKPARDTSTDKLTAREVEVMTLLAQGYRNKEIARRLFLSENTVRRYAEEIYRKLGVNSRVEVAVWYHKRAVNQ